MERVGFQEMPTADQHSAQQTPTLYVRLQRPCCHLGPAEAFGKFRQSCGQIEWTSCGRLGNRQTWEKARVVIQCSEGVDLRSLGFETVMMILLMTEIPNNHLLDV